jgi:hypothetical protein
MDALHSEFPDAFQYSITSFRKYMQTAEFKDELRKVQDSIREEAKEHLLSDRPGRVSVLIEMAKRYILALRLIPEPETTGVNYKSTAKELRETLREIKAEMEVFGETGAGLDLFASLVEAASNLKKNDELQLPSFIQQAIDTTEDEQLPS